MQTNSFAVPTFVSLHTANHPVLKQFMIARRVSGGPNHTNNLHKLFVPTTGHKVQDAAPYDCTARQRT
jgi:hypothetical protein